MLKRITGVSMGIAALLATVPLINVTVGPTPAAAAAVAPTGASAFTPMTPTRLVDTRSGPKLAAGSTTDFQITGAAVPSSATAIVVNVTAVDSAGSGWLQVLPTGRAAVGSSSTLNIDAARQTIPNASFAPLGDGGKLSVHTTFETHLLLDVAGYFTPAETATAGRFVPVTPRRLLDTRSGIGWTPPVTIPPTTPPTTPAPPTPTVPTPTTPSPTTPGPSKPPYPGDVDCKDFPTQAAAQQWFDTYFPWYGDVANLDADNDGRACESLPYRFFANVPPATTVSLQVAGRSGVPPTGVSAVVLSVTAVEPEADGWVQVAPTPVQIGASSTLNVTQGGTIANLAVVPLGAGGKVDLYSTARADLLADVVGYFTDSSAPSGASGLFVPIVPDRRFDSRSLSTQSLSANSISGVETATIASGASAIAGNLTANQAAAGGWAQLAPAPIQVGAASNLNTAYDGQTIANAVVSPVGSGGRVELYTLLPAHLVLDVTGWFTGS